jgi:hypothetical protein
VSSIESLAGQIVSATSHDPNLGSKNKAGIRYRAVFSRTWRFQFVTVLVWALAAVVSAGAQSTDAVILGTVSDAQAGILSGATITVTNTETGVTRSAVTEADGRYRLAGLPPGNYNLRAVHDGFEAIDFKGITLTIGQEVPQNIELKLGGVQQVVSVTARTPPINTTTSEVGAALVQQQQIDSLPIPQRTAALLSLVEPGTTTDVGRASRPSAALGAGAVNAAGTNYLLDGLSNVISGNGDPRDIVQEATVKEFRVILNQTPAEFGGRASGVVTVATKSGTNQFHGEGFEFFRDHYINRVDALTQAQFNSNPTANPIQPFSRNQYGGAIGGPILKDKLHFFFSYEHLDDQEYFTVAPGGLKTPAITAVYAPLEGSFRGGALFTEYFARLDWQINSNNSAWLRVSKQSPATNYAQSANGGNAAAFSSGDSSVLGWTWAAGDTWVISPTVVNQFATQVAQSYQTSTVPVFNTPAQYSSGSIQIKFPNLTWGFSPGTFFHAFYQEVSDDLTVVKGQHTLKFGADLLNTPRNQHATATTLGVWTFSKDYQPTAASPTFDPNNPSFDWSTLASASPSLFTSVFPEIDWTDQNFMTGLYVQDEWKVRPNLTLNLGLRYDLELGVWRNRLNPAGYASTVAGSITGGLPPFIHLGGHGDYNNFAPRIGFAWDPRGNGRTAIRGGFGITNVNLQDNALQAEVYTMLQNSVSIKNPTWQNPYNGQTPASFVLKSPPNVTVNANNITNPKSYSTSLGITQQLTSDLVVSVEGNYTHMTDLIVTENVNTPDPVTNLRPYPLFGQINESAPVGFYNYRGLYVRLEKRYAKRYQYLVSYTLAKQTNNYNSGTAITNFYNPSQDDGRTNFDRRHNLVVSGSGNLWHGITVGAIWSLRSSLPYTALAGTDLNSDGALTDYVPGTSKAWTSNSLATINAWRATKGLAAIPASQIQTNKYNQLDARISKDFVFHERFRLQVIGQLFNVFGTDNYGGVGTTQVTNASTGSATSSGSFGTFTAALPRQQGELAVRFLF